MLECLICNNNSVELYALVCVCAETMCFTFIGTKKATEIYSYLLLIVRAFIELIYFRIRFIKPSFNHFGQNNNNKYWKLTHIICAGSWSLFDWKLCGYWEWEYIRHTIGRAVRTDTTQDYTLLHCAMRTKSTVWTVCGCIMKCGGGASVHARDK